jgi:tetratricopeptide (TPR) repeat protein
MTARFDLGKERAAQGLFDDPIEQFRKAYELWQKDQSHERKRALCSWADALRSQKHYNEAAGKYQEALGIDPAYAEAYKVLATCSWSRSALMRRSSNTARRTSCGGRTSRKSASARYGIGRTRCA